MDLCCVILKPRIKCTFRDLVEGDSAGRASNYGIWQKKGTMLHAISEHKFRAGLNVLVLSRRHASTASYDKMET